MNLIEQLGGYDEAKKILEEVKSRDHIYAQKFEKPALEQALLEYRRQHSIFEVGDKVVAPILHGCFVGKIIAYRSDIDRFDVMGSRHWGWFFAHQLKHATDAEIKAGKRLGVL